MKTAPALPDSFFRWLLHAGVLLTCLFGSTLLAQNTGSITGVVTDKATSGFLVGADVRVAGSSLATATARDGSFSIANVPAGPQSLEVTYVGRKPKIVAVNVRPGANTTTTVDLGESDVLILLSFSRGAGASGAAAKGKRHARR